MAAADIEEIACSSARAPCTFVPSFHRDYPKAPFCFAHRRSVWLVTRKMDWRHVDFTLLGH